MSTPLKKPDSDRRRSERKYTHGHAEISMVNDAPATVSVQVMNISDGGVRIVTSHAFTKDDTFLIDLDGADRKCRVVDCKKLFEGCSVRAEYVD
ncbi:MAG: PilZ domain-containing protein [Planctomycetes bacterium]|nr:PilZ domain-containing protein [Planctomycetota bacterium]